MQLVLDTFYPSITDNDTHLLTKGIGVSGGYGDYAFLDRTGPVTYYNTLYVVALSNAATIATYLNHNSDAARWSARSQTVQYAINTNLFDSSVGAFFDGSCGSTPCATHAQDGNSLAIVSNTVNTTRANSILTYMSSALTRPYGNAFYDNDVVGAGFSQRVYPFISYFELCARFLTPGLAETALEEIRRLYGWMATHDPEITVWEGIGEGGAPYEGAYTSQAHGWATGIVPALTNYVLGVTPTGPGFGAWSVKPVPGDVVWAKGMVPTPYGPITVAWSRNAGQGLFWLSVDAPAGTKGMLGVPVGNASLAVYVDSQLAYDGGGAMRGQVAGSYAAVYSEEESYVNMQFEGGAAHVVTVGFREGS